MHAQILALGTHATQELPLPMQMPVAGAHETHAAPMHMQATPDLLLQMQMPVFRAHEMQAGPTHMQTPVSGAYEMMTRLAASERQTYQLQQQLAQTLSVLEQERLERLQASGSAPNSPAAAGSAPIMHARTAGSPITHASDMTRPHDGGVLGEHNVNQHHFADSSMYHSPMYHSSLSSQLPGALNQAASASSAMLSRPFASQGAMSFQQGLLNASPIINYPNMQVQDNVSSGGSSHSSRGAQSPQNGMRVTMSMLNSHAGNEQFARQKRTRLHSN